MSVLGLLRVAGERERGPSPSYTEPHLILVFLTIGDSAVIGRQNLAAAAGLGEGAIRTILKKLKSQNYLKINASGCSLTRSGQQLYRKLRSAIPRSIFIDSSELTVGKNQVAIIVRRTAERVRDGIDQRDAAVKVGASGATTYVMRNSKFHIPRGTDDCERDFPSPVWKRLRDDLRPRNGDVTILCGSQNQKVSMLGALSAALTLLR